MKFPSKLITKYNKPHFFLIPPMVRFFRTLSRGLGRFLFTVYIVQYLYSNFAKFCLSYQMRDFTLKRKKKGIVSCNALTIMQFDIKLLYLIIARKSKRSEKKKKKKISVHHVSLNQALRFHFQLRDLPLKNKILKQRIASYNSRVIMQFRSQTIA